MPCTREELLLRGVRLEVATVLWNLIEGLIAVTAGVIASSVALIGFGIDSFVETASAAVVGWRLRAELTGGAHHERAEALERLTGRIAGALLLALAAYIVIDAGRRLAGFGTEARESTVGIAVTAISLVVMPLLGWAKLRTATTLRSPALRADAYETITCSWLSFTTLAGLLLNSVLGWAWADPLAALAIVPLASAKGSKAGAVRPTIHGCTDDEIRAIPSALVLRPTVSGSFRVIVCFLIERDKQVLLLRRSMSKAEAPGEWETGSGRVEQGESAVQAVCREAREETGLDVEVLWPIDTSHFFRGPGREETIGITFCCRAVGGSVVISPEHDKAKWVPIEHLLHFDYPEWVRRSLQIFLTRRAGERPR